MLTGIFLHEQLAEAFKKFPSDAVGACRRGRRTWASRPFDRRAKHWRTSRFSQTAASSRSTIRTKGPIRHVGPLLEFSATPGSVVGHAPRSGQHTQEVLREARRESRSGGGHARSHSPILFLGSASSTSDSGWPDRSRGECWQISVRTSSRSMRLHDTYWNGTHMGLGTNRGKRSIALNLKGPAGREALEKLLAKSDVMTLNWRPGAAARLGLDYETLRERYPRLVYCNTRGYEKGPRSDLPGTDQNAAAMTGTEWEDGACDTGKSSALEPIQHGGYRERAARRPLPSPLRSTTASGPARAKP